MVNLKAFVDNVLVEGIGGKTQVVCDIGKVSNIGVIHNRSGTSISYAIFYIDGHGNEIELSHNTIPNKSAIPVLSPNPATATYGFVTGEKIVLRIIDGDPGDGMTFLPSLITSGENIISPRIHVKKGRTVIAKIPQGKIWQVPVTEFYPCGASFVAINNDPHEHILDCFLVENDNNILLSSKDRVAAKSLGNIFSDTFSSHAYIYPCRLEVQTIDDNPFVNLWVACLFAEFDFKS
jgi:hypothetical protein